MPITPGGALLSRMKAVIKEITGPDGGNTLVLEQGGAGLLNSVQKSDPFRTLQCRWNHPDCKVDKENDCMETGKTYSIKCIKCKENPLISDNGGEYRGQTGHSLHTRMLEHMAGIGTKNQSCPLYRHKVDQHPNDDPENTMKKSRSGTSNLHRLALEAEEISEAELNEIKIWNSKSEFGKGKLIRWTPTLQYT